MTQERKMKRILYGINRAFEFTFNSFGEITRAFFWLLVTVPFVMIFTLMLTLYARLLWQIIIMTWRLF